MPSRPPVALAALLAALLAAPAPLAIAPTPAAAAAPWWRPRAGASWQWQLTGRIDTAFDVDVYDVDLFDTARRTVARLHDDGRRVVCYFSAGSYEPWRPDAASLPPAVRGRRLDPPFGDERWLDVRDPRVLDVARSRLDRAAAKGCDAVEPDNVDGYANRSGFPLTARDQRRFNRAIAGAAHARGLGAGLKNDLDQIEALEPDFDFAVNEQCHQYRECGRLRPFVAAGKAVFGAEYEVRPRDFCDAARRLGHSTIFKRVELDAYRRGCG